MDKFLRRRGQTESAVAHLSAAPVVSEVADLSVGKQTVILVADTRPQRFDAGQSANPDFTFRWQLH
jgi:hypothetical protein